MHFAFLASDAEGDTALRRHVADLRSYYEWVASDGNRSPLIERTFEWMDANWPEDDTDVVLSWGDARIGNTMYARLRAGRGARLGDGGAGAPRGRPGLDDLPAPVLRGHRHGDGAAGHAGVHAPRAHRRALRRALRVHAARHGLLHGVRRAASRRGDEPGAAAGDRVRSGRDARGHRRPDHAPPDPRGDARGRLLGAGPDPGPLPERAQDPPDDPARPSRFSGRSGRVRIGGVLRPAR